MRTMYLFPSSPCNLLVYRSKGQRCTRPGGAQEAKQVDLGVGLTGAAGWDLFNCQNSEVPPPASAADGSWG